MIECYNSQAKSKKKQKYEGEVVNRDVKGKNWGFRAILTQEGTYRFDIDTEGTNIAQISVLLMLNEKIKEVIMKSIKEKSRIEHREKVEEDTEGVYDED